MPAVRFLLISILFGASLQFAPAKAPKILDITDNVAANRILTKFTSMIQGSDLGTFLSSRGPFTLFAPTDSAFSKLPPGTLETLLRPENKERLQNILLYHIVNGKKLSAKDLLTATSLLSCQGNPVNALTIKKTKSGVQMVMKAKIIYADIRCLNGVVHLIDTVLIPPEASMPPVAPRPPPTTPIPVAATTNAQDNSESVSPPTSPVATNAATTETPVAPVVPVTTPVPTGH